MFETAEPLEGYTLVGHTQAAEDFDFGGVRVSLADVQKAWEEPLESVFPVKVDQPGDAPTLASEKKSAPRSQSHHGKPKAVIPVFPGSNCEYDTLAAVERAGGCGEVVLVRTLTPQMLAESVRVLAGAISEAQMLIIPGGFSGGDEPDGSAKYIVSLFRNPYLTDAVHALLHKREGLALGICNGFQALLKLGLLHSGKIIDMDAGCPTLAANRIGRHQGRFVYVRVASVLSPWLSKCQAGDVYAQAVSHGEGRFIASPALLQQMNASGQLATQYADAQGNPSMDIEYNPNGSDWAIEGMSSPDGRVFGKMAHTERYAPLTARNIHGEKFLPLFEGGVHYFK